MLMNAAGQQIVLQPRLLLPPRGEARSIALPFITPAGGATSWQLHVGLPADCYEADSRNRYAFAGALINTGARPLPYGHAQAFGGAWNQPHMLLGSWHLWVTAAGELRIKNGAPASESDGTAV